MKPAEDCEITHTDCSLVGQLSLGIDGQTTLDQTTASESDGRVTAKRLLELIERQEYRCALSGEKLTPKTASLDHKEPLSRGGEHNMANVQIVHRFVNRAKGTMSQAEFIEMCRKVATTKA